MVRVLLVLSGKGGCGKTTVACQLALALASNSAAAASSSSSSSSSSDDGDELSLPRVGLLDVDLTGPSVPRVMGLAGRGVANRVPHGAAAGSEPLLAPISVYTPAAAGPAGGAAGAGGGGAASAAVDAERVVVMSLGFLLPEPDAAVVWRGPKKTAMIAQLLAGTDWSRGADGRALDWLVVDTPPGTSDEHIALVEQLRLHPDTFPADQVQAVLVTTPQTVAVADVLREATFCRKTGIPVAGVIENMSGFKCPCCDEVTNVFSSGGGELLATQIGAPFLGAVPIDPALTAAADDADAGALPAYVQGPGRGGAVATVAARLLGVEPQEQEAQEEKGAQAGTSDPAAAAAAAGGADDAAATATTTATTTP